MDVLRQDCGPSFLIAEDKVIAAGTWIDQFPGLQRLSSAVIASLTDHSSIISLPVGSRIYGPGQSPQSYLLLLEGTVRVQQVSEGGREIVLYRVTEGESCALTTACLMGYEDYLAEAVAETAVRAVAIPKATFDHLISQSPEFRRFVFTAFSSRVTNLFRTIDDIAFTRLDILLAARLLELSHSSSSIVATQQQLASELGSTLEVVSRMLAEFQRRGWVSLSRSSLALLGRGALKRLASQA